MRNRIYYRLKPLLPQSVRLSLRRWHARRQLKNVHDVWPIMPGSECPPESWPGWPEGKKFALVLTHDVEGGEGVAKCRDLMNLEMEMEFRSSFNFVPEGSYRVSPELRQELARNGFEVGVHDLNHDGRLFESRSKFKKRSARINQYLRDWGAHGFRSGFMLHNLDWLHDLDIRYDLSTFDSDPFEPQPEGRHTIFPFWVPRPGMSRTMSSHQDVPGYVELPYTLAQDSTLFLVLGETTPEIWHKKLDWIVARGGMALVNTHPDYIDFSKDGNCRNRYPAQRIREFLAYIQEKFAGQFWNPCAKDLADWFSGLLPRPGVTGVSDKTGSASRSRGLKGKRAAVLLYSYYPFDPRPRRAAEALVSAGMEVDLLCLRENDSEPRQEKINGVNVHRRSVRKKRGRKLDYLWQYGRFIASAFLFVTRRGVLKKYDLIHVHNMPDVLVFAALVPKLRGAGVILDLHDPMPELDDEHLWPASASSAGTLIRILERLSIGFADQVITPNLAFKDLFVSRSCRAEKIHIVMNSPNEEVFDPSQFGCDGHRQPVSNEFRIMHHGSIVERHGIDLLVEAVARVSLQIPSVRLDIYGSRTPFLDKVMGTAQRLGIASLVHYHGPKSQPEIAEAIWNCQLGVVPNRRSPFTELNFPTRLFEYSSIHRPVVAPSTKGIRDYFKPEDLVMFECG